MTKDAVDTLGRILAFIYGIAGLAMVFLAILGWHLFRFGDGTRVGSFVAGGIFTFIAIAGLSESDDK